MSGRINRNRALTGMALVAALLGGELHARPGLVAPASFRGGAEQAAAEQMKARYERFKDGQKIWGHGVGRKLALTFDDGPHYQTTPRLLDHLDAFGVKATFFVNGQRMIRSGLITGKSYAALVEAHRRGHLIGNHTWSHPQLPGLSAAAQRRQIEQTDEAIERITGTPTYLFRPPFGLMAPYTKKLIKQRGATLVMWNLGSDDDSNFNVSKVVNTLMRKLSRQGGGIILMHDTHYWSIEAVPALLRAIRIESCQQLARGEEPYEVVGLEYFAKPRRGRPAPRSESEHRAWLERRAQLVKLCQTPPRVPLPAFIRRD